MVPQTVQQKGAIMVISGGAPGGGPARGLANVADSGEPLGKIYRAGHGQTRT